MPSGAYARLTRFDAMLARVLPWRLSVCLSISLVVCFCTSVSLSSGTSSVVDTICGHHETSMLCGTTSYGCCSRQSSSAVADHCPMTAENADIRQSSLVSINKKSSRVLCSTLPARNSHWPQSAPGTISCCDLNTLS